jgi:hypothetical protein
MSIKHEFKYTTLDNRPFLTIDEWVSTLTKDEQKVFVDAKVRQLKIRQQVIDAGLLSLDADGYVWDEEYVKNKRPGEYKQYDREWLKFWERYLEETKIKVEIVEKQIP